jgi:sugar phosphate isomerase/epimerase
MYKVEDFRKFYADIEENTGLTLDTGHANINGQLNSFLTEIPDKIVHIHAHDNLGKTDEHLGVGYGSIDWKNVATLLKRAGFNKVVTVEAVEHVEESIQKLKQLFA